MAPSKPRCRIKGQLQSPLLRLPGEIRTKIYRYALGRGEPLNLWPHQWTKPDEEEKPSVGGLKTRHQESLEYIRKEMATGLLGTCRQIYNEAAPFFWSDNHFKFSGRSGWQGFLRFYLTIGPQARARIQRVSVHAPIYMRWPVKDTDNKDLNGRSKNYPHMHMVRVDSEGQEMLIMRIEDLDRIAIQRICALLTQDRALKEINFVIPDGFRNGDEDSFGGYDEDHDVVPDSPLRLQKIGALSWIKKTVVVEEGGYLATDDGPRQVMDQGWDLVCLAGSFIWEKGSPDKGGNTDYEKHEVTETRTWSSPDRKMDYLIGVKELFDDEQVSVHANGGKHKGSVVKMERSLKGFGGCRFIGSEGILLQVAGA